MAPRYIALLALLPAVFGADLSPNGAQNVALQNAAMAPMAASVLTAAQAQTVIDAAVKKATEIKVPQNIAITDPAGHLLAFHRMDGAMLVSIDVALKKAKTVSLFGGRFRTQDLFNATNPGGQLYGIQQTNSGLIFFGGGVPLTAGGQFVGGVGVSGGKVDEDVTVATAAAAALK